MFQYRDARFRANSLSSANSDPSRCSSPSRSILYDLLTSHKPEKYETSETLQLVKNDATNDLISDLLDETIFSFIKRREFHELSVYNQIEVARRGWFKVFIFELANAAEIDLDFQMVKNQNFSSKGHQRNKYVQCIQNFVNMCQRMNFTDIEYELVSASLVLDREIIAPSLSDESKLKLGQIFLALSDFSKMNNHEIIRIFFDDVEKPLSRILSILTAQ